jgi:hypothetical protein
VSPDGPTPDGPIPDAPEKALYAYQAIDAPSPRTRLVYDPERQAIYAANRFDQQIERFAFGNGMWSALPPLTVANLTDLALTLDHSSLIVVVRQEIDEIALTGGTFTPEKRATNPDPFCGAFFDQAAVTSNGKIFLVRNLAGCSGSVNSYFYGVQSHELTSSVSLFDGIAGASADGSRIYAGESNLSPAQLVIVYNPASDTFATSLVIADLRAVSVSGDASRVVLEDEQVYGRSLTLLGNLPGGGVVLVSRDASRAFVYREDGLVPRIDIYDLNGELQTDMRYPLLKTVMLPDSPDSFGGIHPRVAMTSTPDDSVVFLSGDRRLLVVPVRGM